MTTSENTETGGRVYQGIDIARADAAMRRASIKARRQALEEEGQVMIVHKGEMVWETDPKRIFPAGVEVEICKCGRVIATDTMEDVVYK